MRCDKTTLPFATPAFGSQPVPATPCPPSTRSPRSRPTLRFGGGFYSYGYEITLVEDGVYRMICFGEDWDEEVDLGTFEFPPRGDDASARSDVI